MIYETGVKKITIRLTPYQLLKLTNIKKTFGFSFQRIITDLLDIFAIDTLRVMAGVESLSEAEKESAQKLFDYYVDLDKLKGLVRKTYPQRIDERI